MMVIPAEWVRMFRHELVHDTPGDDDLERALTVVLPLAFTEGYRKGCEDASDEYGFPYIRPTVVWEPPNWRET